LQSRKEIAAMQGDAIAEPMQRDVAAGERQRRRRQIDGIDAGAREGECGQDREAARAGAEVEYAPDGRRRSANRR
jgi:hypothetical protein